MEYWMIAILVVGAIIMVSFWLLLRLGDNELKKKDRANQYYEDVGGDWSPRNSDDSDESAVYDTNGKRIR